MHRFLLQLAATALAVILPQAEAFGWELRVCAEPNNMPFSSRDETGFENRIVKLLAEELGAAPVFVWLPQPRNVALAALLREGECDVVAGIAEGAGHLLTSHAYYRSSFVFVQRRDAGVQITSFDDAELSDLSIGIHYGGEHTSPPMQALVNRKLQANMVPYVRNKLEPEPLARMVSDVAAGRLDVAVAWGPIGGYFSSRYSDELTVVPVSPEIELPFVPMVFPIALGMRAHDIALRDRINSALARRWEEIQDILAENQVPLMALPPPRLDTEVR